MKKVIIVFTLLCTMFLISACNSSKQDQPIPEENYVAIDKNGNVIKDTAAKSTSSSADKEQTFERTRIKLKSDCKYGCYSEYVSTGSSKSGFGKMTICNSECDQVVMQRKLEIENMFNSGKYSDVKNSSPNKEKLMKESEELKSQCRGACTSDYYSSGENYGRMERCGSKCDQDAIVKKN